VNARRQSEKDRTAEELIHRWVSFQMALSDKSKYPAVEFTGFATTVRRYVRLIGRDPMIHREAAKAINGLVDFLKVERHRVPDAIISEASRLESLIFSGYDLHFGWRRATRLIIPRCRNDRTLTNVQASLRPRPTTSPSIYHQ